MAITAKQVNELRKLTGAGMMDCKKALVEAEGDSEKAVEILRLKGQKVSEKRSDRDANEGSVFAADNGTQAVLIELNCETDFVARNEDFQALGQKIADQALANMPADLEGLNNMDLEGRTVAETLSDNMGKIGEKLTASSFQSFSGDGVITYIHPGGRVGVAVSFANVDGVNVEEVGKDIAMQIAAMSPVAIDKDDVDKEVADRELRLGRELAIQEGKPEKIIDKIAEGKLNRFFKDMTLLNQAYVKDSSKTVKQFLKEANPDLKVTSFKRMQVGAS